MTYRMLRRYQYRLYPTKDQEVLLAKHLGVAGMCTTGPQPQEHSVPRRGISLSKYDLMQQLRRSKKSCRG